MRVLDPGHCYELASIDGPLVQTLTFVKRFRDAENHAGATNQEVLRVLINRVEFLDAERPWFGNQDILGCLRRALVLHEARALIRKVEKEQLRPELTEVNPNDGHFQLTGHAP